MKLWIIYLQYYENNATYSPRLMCEAAEKYQLNYELFYAEYFSVLIEEGKQKLYYKDQPITELPDVAFFRGYAFELMQYLEDRCVTLINSSEGMRIVKDKFQTHKLVNNKVFQPKVLKTKNMNFTTIKNVLGCPFVAKDNFGSKGDNVFLVDNEKQFNDILTSHNNIDFIFQEYIEKAKGEDIRVYVVGDKVIGSIKRKSLSGDFRANISQGGVGEIVEVPEYVKNQAIQVSKLLNLNICSVDFLKADEQYYFCEANGNAAFSAFIKNGFKMQDIFMEYISKEYKHIHNYWARLRAIELTSNDYIFLNNQSNVLVSAPHNVSQYREGKFKPKDLGSGELALKLATENNLNYIIKTKNNGNEAIDDDANYYENCNYRTEILNLLNKNSLLLDIHSLKASREEEINIGINGGLNINNNLNLIEKLRKLFEDCGLKVSIDFPFAAPKPTICYDIHDKTSVNCIQLEFKSTLINPKNKNNKINIICECLKSFVNYYEKLIRDQKIEKVIELN